MSATALPVDLGRYLTHCAHLKSRRILTAHQLVLADALARAARRRGRTGETGPLALSVLADRLGMSRQTIVDGLARLEALNLLARIKDRVLAVGLNGGRMWKQLANSYRLLPIQRESRRQTDSGSIQRTSITYRVADAVCAQAKAAQEALAVIGEARRAAISAGWRQQLRRFYPGRG